MSTGNVHRTVWCTSPFELGRRWTCRGDSEGDGDSERDEGRRRYLKADGDIEINNVLYNDRRKAFFGF